MTNPKADTQTLTNRWYDRLKFIAQVLLPGLAALYFGLDQIWGLPKAVEIVGTITVVDTFLGLLLKNLTSKYYANEQNFDGQVIVEPEDGGNKVRLEFDEHPEDIVDDPGKHSLELQIKRKATAAE